MKVAIFFILATLISQEINSCYPQTTTRKMGEDVKHLHRELLDNSWDRFTHALTEANKAYGGYPCDLIIFFAMFGIFCLLLWEQIKSILKSGIRVMGLISLLVGSIHLIHRHSQIFIWFIPTVTYPSIRVAVAASAISFISFLGLRLAGCLKHTRLRMVLAGHLLGPFVDQKHTRITLALSSWYPNGTDQFDSVWTIVG